MSLVHTKCNTHRNVFVHFSFVQGVSPVNTTTFHNVLHSLGGLQVRETSYPCMLSCMSPLSMCVPALLCWITLRIPLFLFLVAGFNPPLLSAGHPPGLFRARLQSVVRGGAETPFTCKIALCRRSHCFVLCETLYHEMVVKTLYHDMTVKTLYHEMTVTTLYHEMLLTRVCHEMVE